MALPAAMSFLVPSAPLARAPHQTVARAATTAAKAGAEARDLTLADVKGSNTDAVWGEIPEDLYFVANYAAALGGDYPPENVDKSYWDQIKPATYAKLAALSKSADPTSISQGQYVMLMEAIVREVRKRAERSAGGWVWLGDVDRGGRGVYADHRRWLVRPNQLT